MVCVCVSVSGVTETEDHHPAAHTMSEAAHVSFLDKQDPNTRLSDHW